MAVPQAPAPPPTRDQAIPRPSFTPAPPPAPARPARPSFTPATRTSRPDPAPPAPRARTAGICIAGAHGGAGTSTLAALLRASLDGADPPVPVREIPPCPDGDPARIASRTGLAGLPAQVAGQSLIVAARGTADGTRRAVIAVTVLERLKVLPPVLAVVADGAGPLPPAAAQRLAQLEAENRVAAVVHIPFAAALRAGGSPLTCRIPGRLNRAITTLTRAAVPAENGERR